MKRRYVQRIACALLLILLLGTTLPGVSIANAATGLEDPVPSPTETPAASPTEIPTPTDVPSLTPTGTPEPSPSPTDTVGDLTPTETPVPDDDTLYLSPDGGYLTLGGEKLFAKLRFEASRAVVEPDDDYTILGFDSQWFSEGTVLTFTIVVAKGYTVSNVTTSAGVLTYLEQYGVYELITSFEPTLITVETLPINELSPTPSVTETPSSGDPLILDAAVGEGLSIRIPYTPANSEDLVLGKYTYRAGDEYIIALSSIGKEDVFELHEYTLTYGSDHSDVLLHTPATLTISLPDDWDASLTRLYSINSSLGTMSPVATTIGADGKSLCLDTATFGFYALVYSPGAATPTPTFTPTPTLTPIPTAAPMPEVPAPETPSDSSATALVVALVFVLVTLLGAGTAFYLLVYKPNAKK